MTAIEKITHISLIALSSVSMGLIIEQRLSHTHPPSYTNDARQIIGRSVRLPGVDWRRASLTYVLYISSSCHFCNESVPFYQQLSDLRSHEGNRASIVVVSSDAVNSMHDYLANKHVSVDNLVHSALDSIGVTGTPTLLVVDPEGLIRRAFVGKLSPNDEKKVMTLVERGSL